MSLSWKTCSLKKTVYMDIQKWRTIMKSCITSQFSYCPLVWIFHSRKLNNKINAIHEKVLRIDWCDKHSPFQQSLDNSVSMHHRNEMFKVNMNLSPDLINDIFLKRTNTYTLRRNDRFSIRQVNSVYHGTKSLSFLGPNFWELVPSEINESESLEIFKRRKKNWSLFNVPVDCIRSIFQEQDLNKDIDLLLPFLSFDAYWCWH